MGHHAAGRRHPGGSRAARPGRRRLRRHDGAGPRRLGGAVGSGDRRRRGAPPRLRPPGAGVLRVQRPGGGDQALLDAGAERVAFVNVDAHHGDGVQWIFYEDPRVLTCSVHKSGKYLFPGTGFLAERGAGEGVGTAINVPLPPSPATSPTCARWRRWCPGGPRLPPGRPGDRARVGRAPLGRAHPPPDHDGRVRADGGPAAAASPPTSRTGGSPRSGAGGTPETCSPGAPRSSSPGCWAWSSTTSSPRTGASRCASSPAARPTGSCARTASRRRRPTPAARRTSRPTPSSTRPSPCSLTPRRARGTGHEGDQRKAAQPLRGEGVQRAAQHPGVGDRVERVAHHHRRGAPGTTTCRGRPGGARGRSG